MNAASPSPRGLSLVELLFSMAIGSLILVLAATMLGGSGDGYARVGGDAACGREVRAAISRIAADLGNACYQPGEFLEKTDRLGFLTLQPADAQSAASRTGDLCAAGYYLKDLTLAGKTTRCLMRGFRESRETFAALRTGGMPGLFAENADADEPLAFGVVAFEVRAKVRDATGAWVDWEKSDQAGPSVVEVRLVVARPELAGKLRNSGDWDALASQGGGPGPNLETCAASLRFGNNETR